MSRREVSAKLAKAARLARGHYTPSLAAFWGDREHELASHPAEGEDTELIPRLARETDAVGGIALNLGRAALELVLRALELPPASEVLITSYSCAGVVTPVLRAGLRPVLVDIDPQLNMSFESVLAADGPNVRAVVLPHLAGVLSRDAPAIAAWARDRDVAVIEDLAQSQGLERLGHAGRFGAATIYSFGGGKLLFGPGGGAVVVRNQELMERIAAVELVVEPHERVVERVQRFASEWAVPARVRARRELVALLTRRLGRTPAATPPGEGHLHGFDVHAISTVEAKLALSQLDRLDDNLRLRRQNAAEWRRRLGGVPGLRLPPDEDNVFAKYWVIVDGPRAAERVEAVRTAYARYGVETETLYRPLHLRPEFGALRHAHLTRTEDVWSRIFCVPVGPELTSDDHARIARATDRAFATT